MRAFCAIACLALSWPAQADVVSELRNALQALKGQTPLSLRVDRYTWKRINGKDQSAQNSFLLEDGPKGLRRTDGNPTGEDEIRAETLTQAQRELLDLLSMTSLRDETPDILDGRPVRKLRVSLNKDKGTAKEAAGQDKLDKFILEATLWIGPDNLPLVVDKRVEVAGRATFFLKFSSNTQDHRRYQRVKDRLVLVEATREGQVKGLGQDTVMREILRVSVK